MNTYKITSYHDIYVDSYEEGEGNNVNSYILDEIIKAENHIDAVNKYFENVLGYNFDIKHSHIEDDFIHYNNLVDVQNYEATETQKAEWKEGRFDLYSNHTQIKIEQLIRIEL